MQYLLRLAEAGRDGQRHATRADVIATLRRALPDATLSAEPGRVVLETTDDADAAAETMLRDVHGVVSYSPCRACALDDLDEVVIEYARPLLSTARSYRVRVTRRGTHALTSQQLAAHLGEVIAARLAAPVVDLGDPEVIIGVEIRGARCHVFHEVHAGADRRARTDATDDGEPRFLVDRMLGTLVGCLRVLGYDTAYAGEEPDSALVRRARHERRVLLTRDRPLSRTPAIRAYFVEQRDAIAQLREVVDAFDLAVDSDRMFTRCTLCNAPVAPVRKDEVADRLPAAALERYDDFTYCRACDKVYWAGTQVDRILAKLEAALGG